MAGAPATLLTLLAAGTLVVGCQTAPSPTSSETGNARPTPPVQESTPAVAKVPKADGDMGPVRSRPLRQ